MPQKTALFLKIIFQVLLITLVSKLPLSPNIFTESKIASYYDITHVKKFEFSTFREVSWKNIKYFQRFKPI